MISEITQNLLSDIGRMAETPVTVFEQGIQIFTTDPGHPFQKDPLLKKVGEQKTTPYDRLESSASPILYLASGKEEILIVLGPYCIHAVMAGVIHDYAVQNSFFVPADFQLPMLSIIQSLSVMELCWRIVFDEYRNYAFLGEDYRALFAHFAKATPQQKKALMPEHLPQPKKPWVIAKELMDCVRNADHDRFDAFLADFQESDVAGKRAVTGYRQKEYNCISGMALLCYAAVETGLSPAAACSICDSYMLKLSLCQKPSQMDITFAEAADSFVEKMTQLRRQRVLSGHVESAKEFMEESLQVPLSLDDIAAHASLSRSQLMRLFQKQEHCTVMEYLQKKRIEAAKELLRTTDYSAAEIAAYYCFSSPSHFSSVFKKVTGMTPSQYRQGNRFTE